MTPTTVYAATFSTVLKTTSGRVPTVTWTASGTGLPTFINALAIDPVAPSRIYAATFNTPAIYLTTNAAASWAALNAAPFAYELLVSPAPLNARLFALAFGVFRSDDSGQTWTAAQTGLPVGAAITPGAIDQGTPADVYVGCAGTIFKTTSAGE